MHVLSMSILLSLSSTSFAELVNNPSSGSTGTASLNWTAADASQLLNDEDDEPTPQGSTSVTTTLRGSNAPRVITSTLKLLQSVILWVITPSRVSVHVLHL